MPRDNPAPEPQPFSIVARLEVWILLVGWLAASLLAYFDFPLAAVCVAAAMPGLAALAAVWRLISYHLALIHELAPVLRKLSRTGLI